MEEIIDSYFTILDEVEGLYKEKGSKFIAYTRPIDDIVAFESFLTEIKKMHPKGRHHCYAYRIGLDDNTFRMNDDGEPSGTAGKPIYGQLQKYNLKNIAVIVVRYFGGTKLGVSGLIQAYKLATESAIENATIVERIESSDLVISFEYANMGAVMQLAKDLKLEIKSQDFNESPSITIQVRKTLVKSTIIKIIAKILNRDIKDVSEDTEQDLCNIKLS